MRKIFNCDIENMNKIINNVHQKRHIQEKKNTAAMTSNTASVLVRLMQCNYCSFNATQRHTIKSHVEKSHQEICVIGLGFTVKYINTKTENQRLKDTLQNAGRSVAGAKFISLKSSCLDSREPSMETLLNRTYKTDSDNSDSVKTAKVEPAGYGDMEHYDSDSMRLKAVNIRGKLKNYDGDELTPEEENRVKLENIIKLEPAENTEANGDGAIHKYLERLRNEENSVKLENTVKFEAVENTGANGDEAIYKYLERLSRGTSSSKALSSCSPKQDSVPVFGMPVLQVKSPPSVSKTISSPGYRKKMIRIIQCNFCDYLIMKKKCCFIKMKQHINRMHPTDDRVEEHNSGYSIQYRDAETVQTLLESLQTLEAKLNVQSKKDFKVPTILNVGTVKIKIEPHIQDKNQKQEADTKSLDDNVKMEVNDFGEEIKEEAEFKLMMNNKMVVKLERVDSDI